MTEKQQSVNSSRVDNATTSINSSDPMRVDFSHPEYCTECDPVSCFVEGKQFRERNWRDILIALTEHFLATKPKAYELSLSSVYKRGRRPFLLKEAPKNYERNFARQISTGYWVYTNLSISNLVVTIGCLCEFCGVNLDDVDIRYVPKSSTGKSNPVMTVESNGSGFAQLNKYSEYIAAVPDVLIEALTKNYPSGFRFETTYINLLSNESGIRIDECLLATLKQIMFHRDDDIFFLLDQATDEDTRKEIIEFSDAFLQKYGCFEISEFYKQYQERINPACIRNAYDFECFYEQIAGGQVRCVRAPQVGNRIARHVNRNMRTIFDEVAGEIVAIIKNKYYGSCTEDDLHKEFCAFSKDLLSKIIKNFVANELVRVEINGSICYQSFEALGLPEDFSDILSTTLERLNEIGLEPSQEVLHTAISLDLGVNLKSELSLPDWDTYRRLIATYYKGEPRREWRNNVFREVED